jgi:hypothetical protein
MTALTLDRRRYDGARAQRFLELAYERHARFEAFSWISRQGPCEHTRDRVGIRAGNVERADGVGAYPRDAAAGEVFVHERRNAEEVGAMVPRQACDPLGRGVGPADRRRDADALERARHPEPGHARIVGGDEDIARMQRAVDDLDGGGRVDGARELGGDARCVGGARGTRIPDDDVQGLSGDEVLGEVRRDARQPRGQRRGETRVREIERDQLFQIRDELMHPLGRQVETEPLHRDEAILFRLIRAKNGTESTSADLMEDTKRPESVGRRSAGSVRVQRWYSSKERRVIVAPKHVRFNHLRVLK